VLLVALGFQNKDNSKPSTYFYPQLRPSSPISYTPVLAQDIQQHFSTDIDTFSSARLENGLKMVSPLGQQLFDRFIAYLMDSTYHKAHRHRGSNAHADALSAYIAAPDDPPNLPKSIMFDGTEGEVIRIHFGPHFETERDLQLRSDQLVKEIMSSENLQDALAMKKLVEKEIEEKWVSKEYLNGPDNESWKSWTLYAKVHLFVHALRFTLRELTCELTFTALRLCSSQSGGLCISFEIPRLLQCHRGCLRR